jgi:hypothetical protein
MLAYPFASLNAAQSSDDAALTSLINDLASAASITISIPSLASTETPSGFTGFQTYTDNILPSISTFSIKETPSSTKGQGAESTALAKRKEIAVGMMAGGVVVGAAGALAGM